MNNDDLKGADKKYKNQTEWSLYWKQVFVKDYIKTCRLAMDYLLKEGLFILWSNIINLGANLEDFFDLFANLAREKITEFVLLWHGRETLDEFIDQCTAALHLKRIDEPDWEANFIANYTKLCKKTMERDASLHFNWSFSNNTVLKFASTQRSGLWFSCLYLLWLRSVCPIPRSKNACRWKKKLFLHYIRLKCWVLGDLPPIVYHCKSRWETNREVTNTHYNMSIEYKLKVEEREEKVKEIEDYTAYISEEFDKVRGTYSCELTMAILGVFKGQF